MTATEIRTTHGTIALANLDGQIGVLERQAAQGGLAPRWWVELVDRIALRGQVLGRIADYERAGALAEQFVAEVPREGLALLTRARTRASLHHFEEALTDLDLAERLDPTSAEVADERAAIFQAVGRYDEAMALRRGAAQRRPGFDTLGAVAVLHADLGEVVVAERYFGESRACFRGVSPFGLAQLDFHRGHMWQEHGDLGRARDWLTAACDRLPAFVRAEGHLAEVEAAVGQREAAIARLARLAGASDDPDYATQLARVLGQAGRTEEARRWRAAAAARYDELVARHPAAFADHAAEFWLTVGGDPVRALDLARQNFAVRQTPRARALLSRARLAREGGPVA